jgi:hypothetical protein
MEVLHVRLVCRLRFLGSSARRLRLQYVSGTVSFNERGAPNKGDLESLGRTEIGRARPMRHLRGK